MRIPDLFRANRPLRLADYLVLSAPLLLFPLAYFPYTLWWRYPFARLVEWLAHGDLANPLRLLFTGNNTILLFWLVVTAVVMVLCLVLAVMKIRPWYVIPLYMAVIFSLCGILSLGLYTLIVR